MQKFNKIINLFPGKLYFPHLLLSKVTREHRFEDRRPCSQNLQKEKIDRCFIWFFLNWNCLALSPEIEMDIKVGKNMCKYFSNFTLLQRNLDKPVQEILREISESDSNNGLQFSLGRLTEVPIRLIHIDHLIYWIHFVLQSGGKKRYPFSVSKVQFIFQVLF